jgi:predicted glycogen debranching enzyme
MASFIRLRGAICASKCDRDFKSAAPDGAALFSFKRIHKKNSFLPLTKANCIEAFNTPSRRYEKMKGSMTSHISREWLETNGIGGFASGTVAGAVSRRYHAFLCAATRAPQERFILVSKIEETVDIGGEIFDLSANIWPGEKPQENSLLSEWSLDPLPRWVYELPSRKGVARIEKTVWMPHGSNTSIAQYRLLEGPKCQLSVRPFVTGRDYHATHHKNSDFNAQLTVSRNKASLQPYSHLPRIYFLHDGTLREKGDWYCDFEWPIEAQRGLDNHEDAWSPGVFAMSLSPQKDAVFVATTTPQNLKTLRATREAEIARRIQISGGSDQWDKTENRLKRAADQFIVKREDGLHTVLAGYHWFTDWGRDTMIALPGLCFSTQRWDIAASILRSFAASMSQGMIPNRFPEAGETPDYNTVDATLWFFYAVARYGEVSGDWNTVRELYPYLCESLEYHLAGTRFGIGGDSEDGLLRAGNAQSQLTWMDAKIGDTAFTPRAGKPVEIQALWHSALCDMVALARRFDDLSTAGIALEWSRRAEANFTEKFWNESESCLYDCIDGNSRDGAIRPNQIFVVSLPHSLLSFDKEKLVVAVVERELLTPHGLRSLSPRDSRYRSIYRGDSWARDSAYHQGTVWAWPLGAFLSAYLKTHGGSNEAKAQVNIWLQPLIAHLDEAGMGTISEIFDGDAPHTPRGCIAQAWSVSEVLRLWQEVNN